MRYSFDKNQQSSKKRSRIFPPLSTKAQISSLVPSFINVQQSQQNNNSKSKMQTSPINNKLSTFSNSQQSRINTKNASRNYFYESTSSIDKSLLTIKGLLLYNQQKIKNLEISLSNIQTSMLKLYHQHQNQLKSIVSMRCQQFTTLLKKTINIFIKGQQYTNQIEKKVNLCTNTMRNISQSLRLTKIKQDCIEAICKYNNQKCSSMQLSAIENSQINSKIQVNSSSSKSLSSFWKNSQTKIQPYAYNNSQSKNHKYNNSKIDYIHHNPLKFGNFTKKDNNRIFTLQEKQNINGEAIPVLQNQKLSPFQANQMLQISVSQPLKPVFKKNQQKVNYMLKKQLISVITKTNGKFPLKCYLDQMGCLRRQNGTYLFDEKSNAIVMSRQQFEQFRKQQIIQYCFP